MKKIFLFSLFTAQTALYAGNHKFPLSPLGPTDQPSSFSLARSSSPLPLDAQAYLPTEKTPSSKRQRTMDPSTPTPVSNAVLNALMAETLLPYPSSIPTPSQPTAIDLFAIAHEEVDNFFVGLGVSPTSTSSSSSSSSSSGSSFPPQEKVEQYLDALFGDGDNYSATPSSASTSSGSFSSSSSAYGPSLTVEDLFAFPIGENNQAEGQTLFIQTEEPSTEAVSIAPCPSSSSIGSSSVGDYLRSQAASDSLSSSSSSSSSSGIAKTLPPTPLSTTLAISSTKPSSTLIHYKRGSSELRSIVACNFPRCGQTYDDPDAVEEHFDKEHAASIMKQELGETVIKKKSYTCKECKKNNVSYDTINLKAFKNHLRQHAASNIYQITSDLYRCNLLHNHSRISEQRFRNKDELVLHLEEEHRIRICLRIPLVTCGLCPEEIRPTFCCLDDCSDHISGPAHLNLTKDTIERYTKECVDTCGIEPYGTPSRSNLLAHRLSTKHLPTQKAFLCAISSCYRGFRDKRSLDTHIKQKHSDYLLKNSTSLSVSDDTSSSSSGSDTKLVRCGLCPEEIQPSFFNFNACLAHISGPAHLNLTKDTIKRYMQECVSICGIKYSSINDRFNLLRHRLSEKHLGKKLPFLCAIDSCNEGFREKRHLNTHIKEKHPDYLLKNSAGLSCRSSTSMSHSPAQSYDSICSSSSSSSSSPQVIGLDALFVAENDYSTAASSTSTSSISSSRSSYPVRTPTTISDATDATSAASSGLNSSTSLSSFYRKNCTIMGCSQSFTSVDEYRSHMQTKHGIR